MKRLMISITLLIAIGITIYTVLFWEPEEAIGKGQLINSEVSEKRNEGIRINRDTEKIPVISKSIFKVDDRLINEKITKSEKEKINGVLSKLSTIDLGRIQKLREEDNKEKGAREILNILSKRLPLEDYGYIKEILSNYIDFSAIGQEV